MKKINKREKLADPTGDENQQDNGKIASSKSRRLLIILPVAALVLLCAASVYIYFTNKPHTNQSTSSHNINKTAPPAVSGDVVVPPTPKLLIMQLGRKIALYDVSTGKSRLITDKIPADKCEISAKVVDFYYKSDDEWRYYAVGCLNRTIYYADQENHPRIVKKFDKNVLDKSGQGVESVVANSNRKTYAYSIRTHPSWPNPRIKTYISVNDAPPRLIYESDLSKDSRTADPDVNSYYYIVDGISPGGGELLFQQEACFDCGGYTKSNIFSLNIKTKKTRVLYKSENAATVAQFNDYGGILFTSGTFNYGYSPSRINLVTYVINNNQTKHIYSSSDKAVSSYSIDRNGKFVFNVLRDSENDASSLVPGNLYSVLGNKSNVLMSDLGTWGQKAPRDYSLGKSIDDCVSIFLYDKNLVDQAVGVICKDTDGVYRFKSVLDAKNHKDNTGDLVHALL